MVTETQADCLLSAIILFRFETDLICKENAVAWRFFQGHFNATAGQITSRRQRGTYVMTQLKAKKSSVSHGSIVDIDQQDISIVARAPHEDRQEWEMMSVDDLWGLHESIVTVITRKIHAETQRLENRLRLLGTAVTSSQPSYGKSPTVRTSRKPGRRPYPEVKPKYRDHANPSVTWSGRGKLPRWLSAQISLGRQLDEFKIG